MPRNKTANRAKRTMKSSDAQRIEKEFLQLPAKLSQQLEKEISAQRAKEAKLKKMINKLKVQVKNAEGKAKIAANKAKNSPAGKKAWNIAKKAHQITLNSQNDVNKELQEVAKNLTAYTTQQNKLNALTRVLNQFEKQWAKDSKKRHTTSKNKNKKTSQPSYVEPAEANPIQTAWEDQPAVEAILMEETQEM